MTTNKTFISNVLFWVPLFLMGLGILMIYSSSSVFAAERMNDTSYFFRKQLAFGVCGIVCMLCVRHVPYERLGKLAYPLWFSSLLLLVLVLVPGVGIRVNGAIRWLPLGPLSFQPSELAKLSTIILLAYSLARKEQRGIKSFSVGVMPHLILVVPVCTLILMQPDFGTTLMLALLLFAMLFVAGLPLKYLAAMGASSVAGAMLVVFCKRGYILKRIEIFLDPGKDPTGAGYHIIQSFRAFSSGGTLGTGLGQGVQKLFYLPEAHTDFILSAIGEELGFVGVLLVIVLFCIFIMCGLKISLMARDLFGSYLAMGIIFFIGMQAAINMGVAMGLLPAKGTPLPFVSYGGTSLMVNLICVGILLSIAARSNSAARR